MHLWKKRAACAKDSLCLLLNMGQAAPSLSAPRKRQPSTGCITHGCSQPLAEPLESLSRSLARQNLCMADEQAMKLGGCGVCQSCRQFDAGAHPDRFELIPDAKGPLPWMQSVGLSVISDYARTLGL